MVGIVGATEPDWELLARIRSSKPLRGILLELLQSVRPELTQRILWKRTGASIGHLPGHLQLLMREGLVECLTPKARRDKLYRLTDRGRVIARHIIELDSLEQAADLITTVLGKVEVKPGGVPSQV